MLLACDENARPLAGLCEGPPNPASTCHERADVVLVEDAISNFIFYNRLVDGLSARNYELYERSGHNQFSATFATFRATEAGRDGDILAEIMAKAGQQNIAYPDLMVSSGMFQAAQLAAELDWNDDLANMRRRLSDADLNALVAQAVKDLDARERGARRILACGTSDPDPGCAVTVRYLAQVIRVFPAPQVFAQIVHGFRLAQTDPRIVGINLVAPEDDPVTLRDYTQQMEAVGFAGAQAPDVAIALHAGESTMGLVPPEGLRFHIRQAVEIAGPTGSGTEST